MRSVPLVTKPKVGILGSGDVARTLGGGFAALGHEVKLGSRSPTKLGAWKTLAGSKASVGTFQDAAKFGDVMVVATLGTATEDALKMAGPAHFGGKVVIDSTNALKFETPSQPPTLFVGHSDSLAERIQRALPGAKVVKAFNTIGNAHMFRPQFPGGPPDFYYCGDDAEAKKVVAGFGRDFGHNPVDVGGLASARYLEPMAMVWIYAGILGGDWNQAFRLLKK